MQPEHIEPAGGLARQIDRGLDRIAAADQEQRAFERFRQQLAELLVEAQPRHVQHRVAGVHQGFEGPLDRRDDARVLMPERRAHLAGLEIEVFLALGIDDRGAMGLRQDRRVLDAAHVARLLRREHPAADDVLDLAALHRQPLPEWRRFGGIVACLLPRVLWGGTRWASSTARLRSSPARRVGSAAPMPGASPGSAPKWRSPIWTCIP